MANDTDRVRGKVKWFNDEKGYGFIGIDGEADVFVHHSAIRGSSKTNRLSLQEGAEVELSVSQAPKGPQAGDVVQL